MKTIVWFTGNATTAATVRMIAALKRYAQGQGWQLLVLPKPRGDAAMRTELAFWKPDGVVTDPSYDPAVFGALPVVIMSSRPASYRGRAVFIEHDARSTTACAAEELLALGYANFGYVGAQGNKVWSRERADEFCRILARHGHTCSLCTSPETDRLDPLRFQKRLRRFLQELRKPCALLAAHDQAGQYVIYAANALGLAVPDEIAVCSIDNDESICLNTSPTLTSVLIDFARAGEMAGAAFAAMFAGRSAKTLVRTYGAATVLRRGSTARLVRRDAAAVQAQEFIRREVARGITAAEVARGFDCTPRMAQLRFRRATGHSIMEEILAARTEAAQQLLRDTSLPLDAVAQLSGWRTLRNFQHHFTRAVGRSPGQWRAAQLA